MSITQLPTPPSRQDPANFSSRADQFLTALPTFATEANNLAAGVNTRATQAAASATNDANSATQAANSASAAATSAASAINSPGTSATSTTSLSVSTGSKSLTVQTGKAFVVGQPVMIARTSEPSTTWMHGKITSYNSSTGALVVNAELTAGSGTFTDWTISLSGPSIPGRQINGTLFDGNSDITTATWGTARTITIGNTGKSVNGSANVSWSLGEIGAAGYGVLANNTDLNGVIFPGFYRLGNPVVNAPPGVQHGQLLVSRGGGDTIFQIVTGHGNGEIYWRQGSPPDVGGGGAWSAWHRFFHSGNISTANAGTATNATNLTGTSTSNVPTSALGSDTANNTTYLRGDRTWAALPTMTATTSGLVPTPPNNANMVLLGNATWGTISTVGRLVNIVRFTTPGSGTYTRPSNVARLLIRAIGGGGGGGGNPGTGNGGGGGGGSGGYSESFITSPGSSYSYTVGAGGGGSVGGGANGGNTTIAGMTADGGRGGGPGGTVLGPGGSGNPTAAGVFGGGGGGGDGGTASGGAGGAGYIEIWEFA